MREDDAVIIEMQRIGAYVRVSAMDPVTLTEVAIVGDPGAGEAALRRTVLQKLRYVLEKQSGRPASRPRGR